ncbi:MAG: hypothetical protein ABI384_01065 [Allobranchiibius sp.]
MAALQPLINLNELTLAVAVPMFLNTPVRHDQSGRLVLLNAGPGSGADMSKDLGRLLDIKDNAQYGVDASRL